MERRSGLAAGAWAAVACRARGRGGTGVCSCVHVERVVVNFTDDRRGASRRVEQHLHFPCRDGSL